MKDIRVLVTSGPTFEPVDPVRFIGNRSSGKQGHAVAAALRDLGAKVTLITGPVAIPDPKGVRVVRVRTALQMLEAVKKVMPADVAVCAAAVSDWRVKTPSKRKLKKVDGLLPALELVENPDILKTIAQQKKDRPRLVVGFAAETENVVKNAAAKRRAKGCDWMVANNVSIGGFDDEDNEVTLINVEGSERWPRMSKKKIAHKLARQIAKHLKEKK